MYGKTFQSLWLGSMRGKPELQLVFIYMFCNCDRDGVIDCIPQVIADATGLEDKQVVDAICELESADPDSRTAENEGRRIEQIDANRTWGWRIINHAKYLREGSEEHRKEKSAERQKRHRERNAPVTHSNAPVTPVSISVSSSESGKEGDCKGETEYVPSWRDSLELYLAMCRDEYSKLLKDSSFIAQQEKYHPNVNIRLSLEKALNNFWATEAGWLHKKKSKAKEINWRLTFTNAIDMNRVFNPNLNRPKTQAELNGGGTGKVVL